VYPQRCDFLKQLEEARNSRVILFVTGDRPGLETQIASDVYHLFANHLDLLGKNERISLFLYTRGGDTLTAWSIVNLIRQFCDDFEVIVPSRAHSSGTLMALGANRIVMTKQATLGPIDPSVNTPLNPIIPGLPQRAPVSVEAINGFLDLAKEQLRIQNPADLATILIKLCTDVHPLVLGAVYRSKSQIQMIARKLIAHQVSEPEKVDKIISFLCSESGSHDYTIHRREARDNLGLKIETPTDSLYATIKALYNDIHAELQLSDKFDPLGLLGIENQVNYSFKRALIESCSGGSDYLASEGRLTRVQLQMAFPNMQPGMQPAMPPGVQPSINQERVQRRTPVRRLASRISRQSRIANTRVARK